MRIALGHLEQGLRDSKETVSNPNSGAKIKVIKNDLEESECECDDCSRNSKQNKKVAAAQEDDQHSVDMMTKIFTSLMQCTASNVSGNQLNKEINPSMKGKGLKQVSTSKANDYGSDREDDPLARGILGKGCSSDFSVSQSLYPDDILVSYEPKKKKAPKPSKAPTQSTKSTPLSASHQPKVGNLKDVRIIPINKTTNAKILPNRKFKESKYDVSCISVPTFCNKAKLISCCSSRLAPPRVQIPRCDLSQPDDENLMISVPSAIYPDNIILTLKNPKRKKNKK